MTSQEWANLKRLADLLEQMARQMEEQRQESTKQKRPVKTVENPIPPQLETA